MKYFLIFFIFLTSNLLASEVKNLSPQIEEVASELRCPTCKGMSILDSQTLQSTAMLNEVKKQIHEGKSKAEVLNYFRERYGEWIFRKPDPETSLGFMIWLIPLLGLFLGPFILLTSLYFSYKRNELAKQNVEAELHSFIARMKGKLP
jgi:cytochrome c-type biogenesis protein CcmH/NrfF